MSASSLIPVHDALVRGDVAALTSLLVVDKKLVTAPRLIEWRRRPNGRTAVGARSRYIDY